MAFEIRPLSASLFPRYAHLTRHANATSQNTLTMLGPVTPALISYYASHDLAAFEARPKHDYWLGVFECGSEAGELVAVARWTLKDPSNPEGKRKVGDWVEYPPGANVEAMKDFWADLEKVKEEVMRRREGRGVYWYLTALAADVAYQGRGAGKALLEWGIQRADREGRECFLVANVNSRGLYEKMGFVVVKECGWDGEKWGAKKGWGNWAMIRPSRGGKEG